LFHLVGEAHKTAYHSYLTKQIFLAWFDFASLMADWDLPMNMFVY